MRPLTHYVVTLVLFLASIAVADEQKTFMHVRDGPKGPERILVREVGVMRQMLKDAGYDGDIGTPRDATLATATLALTHVVHSDLRRLAGRDGTLHCNQFTSMPIADQSVVSITSSSSVTTRAIRSFRSVNSS